MIGTQGPNTLLTHLFFYLQPKYLTSCDIRLSYFIANATGHVNFFAVMEFDFTHTHAHTLSALQKSPFQYVETGRKIRSNPPKVK